MTIFVAGGGCSGALLVAELLRRTLAPLHIVIADGVDVNGRGVAYGAPRPEHLLNVPAARMGALAEDPEHFWRWAQARGLPVGPHDFAPRALYGDYIEDLFTGALRTAAAEGRHRVEVVREHVLDVALEGGRARVVLQNGASYVADRVVLALGHTAPHRPAVFDPLAGAPGFVDDPWDCGRVQALAGDGHIVIVGTGLTMVDTVLTFHAQGHRGTIEAISRHGLPPRVHPPAPLPRGDDPGPVARQDVPSLRALLRERRLAAAEIGVDAAVDALRSHTQRLWRAFSEADRQRFLRHVRPRWDVLRHRIAPEIGRTLETLRAEGRLAHAAGHFAGARRTSQGFELLVANRDGSRRAVRADGVVLATGPDGDLRRRGGLVERLIERGLLVPHPVGFALRASPDGALIDSSGHASSVLHAIGPLLRGELWESIAVPEIRVQVARLAATLCRC